MFSDLVGGDVSCMRRQEAASAFAEARRYGFNVMFEGPCRQSIVKKGLSTTCVPVCSTSRAVRCVDWPSSVIRYALSLAHLSIDPSSRRWPSVRG